MRAESQIADNIFSGHANIASHLPDICQGYEHQQAIKAKCFHPLGKFEEFPKEDVETSIPKRFEKIVRMYPERVAVKDKNHALTYRVLDQIANRIAQAILARCGEGNEPIGLIVRPDTRMYAAILGILKAGKIYVPLDPLHPTERNSFIVADSQPRLIVADNDSLAPLDKLGGPDGVLNIDDLPRGISEKSPGLVLSPDTLAYIMYTSGSTGQPKGVTQSHRNILHKVLVHTNDYHITNEDCLAQLYSYSFSGSVRCIFCALLNGATSAPFDIREEGRSSLADWLVREAITVYLSVPSLFRQLVQLQAENIADSKIRLVHLGSEAVTAKDVDHFKKHFPPQCILVISMASSEAGTVLQYFIGKDTFIEGDIVPVGYEFDGKEVFLLDVNGNPAEFDTVGEIAVRSRFLSPGYWRKPDLTRSVFLPGNKDDTGRVYLSGDLGRRRADGSYLWLGRKDSRIKVRGQWVDTAAIESVLTALKAVAQAAVVPVESTGTDKSLVAYLVLSGDRRPTISGLRETIRDKLSNTMVPSRYVFIDTLPLLPNGKIDRAALLTLPGPGTSRPELDVPYRAPRSAHEQQLAEIWTQVLALDRVGILDDFFELGGHSLLAARLFFEIEKTFGKQLPLTTLFWARNVEQLARIIQHEEWSAPWSLMFPIQTTGSRPPFFWVYGETSDVLLPRYLGSDQPLYGLMHEARTGKRVRYNTVPDIAADHLKEIQKVQPQGPYFLGGFCFGGMVAFEIAQQLQMQGQEVALLFLVDLGALNNWRSRFEETDSFLNKVRQKVASHSRSLARLDVREKFKYVRVRARDRIDWINGIVENIALTLARNTYFATGRPLPESHRLPYLTSVDQWAMRHYVPDMYPGDLILFKSAQKSYDPELIGKLIGGKFQLHEVPSSHSDLLKEPNIALWANELRACLQKAQTAQRGFHPSRSSREVREEWVAD